MHNESDNLSLAQNINVLNAICKLKRIWKALLEEKEYLTKTQSMFIRISWGFPQVSNTLPYNFHKGSSVLVMTISCKLLISNITLLYQKRLKLCNLKPLIKKKSQVSSVFFPIYSTEAAFLICKRSLWDSRSKLPEELLFSRINKA